MTTTTTAGGSPLKAISLMLAGAFLFVLNSAAGKWLITSYPVGEFLFIRSAMGLLVLSPFIWTAGRAAFFNAPQPRFQLLRMVLTSVEVAMFFWALSYLPLADTQTFYLAAPIYVTALAALLLGESVDWRGWVAVLVGFGGVVITLKPSSASFTLPALIALSGSIIFALVMITTRKLRGSCRTMLIAAQVFGVMVGAAFVPSHWAATAPSAWIVPSVCDMLIFAGLGLAVVLTQYCIVRALDLAEASTVTPFQNTTIVWSVLLDALVFHQLPGAATILGAALIVGAVLYLAWRQRVTTPRPAPP